jgi:hypothetical protein
MDFPKTRAAGDATAISNISSTTYATGSPIVSLLFTAPTSGRVRFITSLAGQDNSGDNRIFLSPQVFTGMDATGVEIVAPSVASAVSSMGEASAFSVWERCSFLDGLTPGSTYYVRLMHRVTGGSTCDIAFRGLIVVPLT